MDKKLLEMKMEEDSKLITTEDIEKAEGIQLFKEALLMVRDDNKVVLREIYYMLAMGNFKMKDYITSKRWCERLGQLESEKERKTPQAEALEGLVDDKLRSEGLKGIALAVGSGVVIGTGVAVGAGIAGLIAYKYFKKK